MIWLAVVFATIFVAVAAVVFGALLAIEFFAAKVRSEL